MSERDDFLTWLETRQRGAEMALHNGEAQPRTETWSHRDPVTLFGAYYAANGWDEISVAFQRLGDSFSELTSYQPELIAADVSGDLAYTVGYERTDVSFDGVASRFNLRVTQVYRREDGEWKVIHRHADQTAG